MRSQKLLAAIVTLSLAFGMVPLSLAQPAGQGGGSSGPGKHQGGPRQGGHEQMMKQLGLSQEQMEKIKAIRQKNQGQGQQLHQQIQQKRKALMQYMSSPNATEAQAMTLSKEIANLQQQVAQQRISTWFQMKAILTPEQLQKLQQLRQQFQQRRGPGGRGPAGGMGGGRMGPGGQGMQGSPQGALPQPVGDRVSEIPDDTLVF